jgi:WD40 repeat protein
MVAAGKAQVTVSFDAWEEGKVAAVHQEIEIVPAAPDSQLTVSGRLQGELIHPNKQAMLQDLRFSPDGKRLLAGDTSAGIIQIWDVASRKPLTSIATEKAKMGRGAGRGAASIALSPDWTRLYAKKGSGVGVWDPQSGRQIDTLEDKLSRGIRSVMLSSDGNVLLTTGAGKAGAAVWDLSTRKAQSLPGNLPLSSGALSRDGKYFAGPVQGEGYYSSAIQVIDLATGKVRTTIAIPQKLTRAYVTDFSPDGKLIRGAIEIYAEHLWQKWEKWQYITRFWDAATGKEVASFPADESETSYSRLAYSPDGKTLAATRWTPRTGTRAEKLHANLRNGAKLFLLDIPGKRLRGIILQENAVVGAIAFSPDSRWVAAVTQPQGRIAGIDTGDVDNLPQARIHLVDAHTAQVRELLIAPRGHVTALSFSPNGKTLAIACRGKALLWDVTPASGPHR